MGHVHYHANSQTLGVARSLRDGIKDSKGEFVAILNDDDYWEPDFLTSLLPPLQADSRRVLAFSDHWLMNANGELELDATEANTARYGRAFLAEGDIPNPSEFILVKNGVPLAMGSVFRKNALDASSLNSSLSGAYDFWISCALASTRGSFYYVSKRLTRWRLHSQMETNRRSLDKSECNIYILTEILSRRWFPEFERCLRFMLAEAWFRVGRDKMDFKKRSQACSCFLKSFLLCPKFKPLIAIVLAILPYFIFEIYLKITNSRNSSIL
jgi:glycosyltransferase involved in cell wall biosynthesis